MAVTQSRPAKPTAGTAIIEAIRQHGPLTPAELRRVLPPMASSTIKMSAARLSAVGVLTRTPCTVRSRDTIRYGLGRAEYQERKPVHFDTDDDAWQPVQWIHPIRARALGLR